MPMIVAFTAAEIAAAEAAAIAAAEIAAAEAAAAAAATAATEAAAAQTATTVASQAVPEVLAGAPPPVAAQPTAAEFLASGVNPAAMAPPPPAGILQAAPAAPAQPMAAAGSTPSTTAGVLQAAPPPAATPPASGPMINPESGQAYTLTNTAPAGQPLQLPPGAAPEAGYTVEGSSGPSSFDKFSAFADKHPFMTGASMYTAASGLGLMGKGSEMPQRMSYGPQYRLSENFQTPEPRPNVYTPSYKTYAEGGVMTIDGPEDQMPTTRMEYGDAPGYAKGGTLSDTLDFYKEMSEARPGKGASAPKADADVGIYYDQDPDTRYQDALTAAQIRQAKLNKRSSMQTPSGGVMRRPTPMGQINLSAPGAKAQDGSGATEAARGGIMQANDSSLGGYAAGGSPRLLRGPGDGMSDNIPAMIGRKQPARLADGEFVIPADVVSHLGNGSTEAGAKRLHEMMTKVRKDRTGNPKQGKQINPRKYMPK